MYCQKCGKEIKENIRFCPGCGAPVKALEEIGAEAKTERKPEAMKENQQPQKPKKKKGRKMIIILLGICVLAIAILIAVFSILKQRKEKMFASNIEAGNNYLEQLDYEKAEDSFLQAIKINPKEKEPYVKLSELYIANDEVEKAQNIVAQAIENIPKEDKKEFQTKQEEWKNLEDYTWVVNPEIEADDIYYLRGRDFYKHSDNEMKRQLYNEYAVIRQGTTYGLIDMDGNWYKDLKCNVVKTILDYYEIETKNPIYSEEFETDMNDYYIKDGQLVAAVAVYGDSYGAQGAYYYVDTNISGLYNTLDTEIESSENWLLNDLITAIPVGRLYEKYTGSEKDQNGNWLSLEEWLKNSGSKYAIWNHGELVTDFIYDECGSVGSGLLAVKKDGKWGYVDEEGNEIIKPEYDASWQQYTSENCTVKEFCYAASCGYVPLVKDGVWELRNTKGDLVIAPSAFEVIRPVYDGKCWVKRNGKWGVISLNNSTEKINSEEDNQTDKTEISEEEIYEDLIKAYGKYFYSDGNENIGYIDQSRMGIANPYHGLYPARTEYSPDIYYALYDINNDGHKECFFTSEVGTEQSDYPGYYDIWTNDGETPYFVMEGGYRTHQIICTDGTIKNNMSGGAWTYQNDFYSFDDTGVTTTVDSYSADGDAQSTTYFNELEGYVISREEMEEVEAKHPRADVQFEWIKINEE